ncbi:MAG: autotransporter outer membrane beta-barrel domain-containing protein, partial [Gammaproteobacteria bacterium]
EGGSGAYFLNGGSLNVRNEIVGGGKGSRGVFNQSGGTHTVSETLAIGQLGGNGIYQLSGGNLNVTNETVGDGGIGTFTQRGGIHTVTDNLTVGKTGSYFLSSGGTLIAPKMINEGVFNQSGGVFSGTFHNNSQFFYSGGVFEGSLENNGTAIFNPPELASFGANISGSGSLTKEGGGTLILTGRNTYSGGTTVSDGVLQGNTVSLQGNITNNATVVFDQADIGIYTGTMSGEGKLIKQNSGILILNNENTYREGTEIKAGNLQVGDADHPDASIFGPVMIDPAGILSGHGSINGNVTNFGTISPGGSIGTLTVDGDVAFNSQSIFNVEISPQQSSLLDASGLASLGNANVSVLAQQGGYSPNSYTILQAESIAGSFNNVNIVNAASVPSLTMLTPSLQYFSDHVNLNLDVASDPTGPTTSITDKLFKAMLRTMGGRLNAPLECLCPENSSGFWGRGVGMISSADASGDAPGYDAGTAGAVLGIDHQFGEHLMLGIAGFTAHTEATTYQRFDNESTADSAGFSLYGAYTDGAWQFKEVIGYDNDTYEAQRTVAVSRAPRQAQSKTHANRVNSYSEASYSFKSGNLTLQPLAGLQLGWMHRDGFTETGPNDDGQNISVDGRTLYSLDTLIGLRARYALPINKNLKAQFEVRGLYDHDFGTLQDTVVGSFIDGQPRLLSTSDRPTQRDAGIVGASVSLLTADSLNFYLDYNGDIRSGQQAHFIGAGIRYSW